MQSEYENQPNALQIPSWALGANYGSYERNGNSVSKTTYLNFRSIKTYKPYKENKGYEQPPIEFVRIKK